MKLMKRWFIFAVVILIMFSGGSLYSGETKYSMRLNAGISLPFSSYISTYLDTGLTGGLDFSIKKDFWMLSMQYSVGFIMFPLKDTADSSFIYIPITIGLMYKIPLMLPKGLFFHAFIETGIGIEMLRGGGKTDIGSGFVFNLGPKFTYRFHDYWEAGLYIKWATLTDKDETASFLNFQLFAEYRL